DDDSSGRQRAGDGRRPHDGRGEHGAGGAGTRDVVTDDRELDDDGAGDAAAAVSLDGAAAAGRPRVVGGRRTLFRFPDDRSVERGNLLPAVPVQGRTSGDYVDSEFGATRRDVPGGQSVAEQRGARDDAGAGGGDAP